MSWRAAKSSIVGRTAALAALLSSALSIFIFAIVFAAQQSSYEAQLAEHLIASLKGLEFNALARDASEVEAWLESNAAKLRSDEDVVYAYVLHLGADGVPLGEKMFPEEPNFSFASSESPMVIFRAKGSLLEAHQSLLAPYGRLGLLTMPIYCQKRRCADIRLVVSLARIDELLQRLRVSLLLAGLLIPLATGLTVFLTAQHYLTPIRRLSQRMRELSSAKAPASAKEVLSMLPDGGSGRTIETTYFTESVALFAETLEQANALRARLHASESMAQLAKQVAHDIRSPAAALRYALTGDEVPHEKRLMVRQALDRIQGIADSLLTIEEGGYSLMTQTTPSASHRNEESPLDVAMLLREIVREKRLRAMEREGVDFNLVCEPYDGYGGFIGGSRKEILRVFSNIVDNALDAISGSGSISIVLYVRGTMVEISFQDNGCGISPEILPRIFSRGFTHGKATGTGLGLYHARSVIETLGGTVTAESHPQSGTTIKAMFPRQPPPAWFVPELAIAANSKIVICDDDPSVHSLWQTRLSEAGLAGSGALVINFQDLESFKSWCNIESRPAVATLFLVDHDFVGEKATGLDVIRSLGLSWQAILVSSFVEYSTDLYEKAGQLAFLPKDDLERLPIRFFSDNDVYEALLVEDSPFVIEAWHAAALVQKVQLGCSRHPREVLTCWHLFKKDIPIFIDADLGHGAEGVKLAEMLHGLGFDNISITTGFDKSDFQKLDFLRGVIGKDPPDFRGASCARQRPSLISEAEK